MPTISKNYINKLTAMSKQVIATVNINIGLDNNNPVLIIHEQEDISELISKLIEQYSLPKKVHAIIMERVQEQLNKTALEAKQEKQLKKCQGRVTEADKSLLPMNVPPSPLKDKKSCSPLNRKDLSPVKLRTPLKTNITKKDLSANKFV